MAQRGVEPVARVTEMGSVVKYWPYGAQRVARALVRRYGLPHEVGSMWLAWHYCGPWKRTVAHRDGALHRFPVVHRDYLAQTVDFRVPVEACGNLAAFDGSIIVDRTRGELTAFCASEEANFLLLNLANDLVLGKRTVAEARRMCASVWAARRVGWPMPSAAGLGFSAEPRTAELVTETGDPDQTLRVVPGWR